MNYCMRYYYVDGGVRSVYSWISILFYYVVLFEWLTIVKSSHIELRMRPKFRIAYSILVYSVRRALLKRIGET